MPAMNLQGYTFLLILLIVPVQYFLTYFNTSDSIKALKLHEIKTTLNNIKEFIFHGRRRIILQKFLNRIFGISEEYPEEKVDSELLNNPEKNYFASSPIPRTPRPGHVEFRVGQVVKHLQRGVRGVIVGWDERTQAPPMWIQYVYPQDRKRRAELLSQPSYMVLADQRDTSTSLRMYVSQTHLYAITHTKIVNNEVDEYFESYNGIKYTPRPFLQNTYPED